MNAMCGVKFGLFTKKHTCHNCSMVFCGNCSSMEFLPNQNQREMQKLRTCKTCFEDIKNLVQK